MKRQRKTRKSKYLLFRFGRKEAARVTRDNFDKKRPKGASVAASNKRRTAEKRISGSTHAADGDASSLEKKTRGKKITCACGQCAKCRHRDNHQRYERLKAGKPVSEPSDQELDEIMTRYFATRGWD